jgi:glycine/D-amino acid oxidase-like deaminating enzyme
VPKRPSVAIIGAGIMGCCAALFLTRAGWRVTLIDRANVMCGASRWNEGKVHLGYLYSADPSGSSAAKMIDGGLAFKPLLNQLIGRDIAPAVSSRDDIYLVHPASVVSAGRMQAYFDQLDDVLAGRDAAGYPGPIRRSRVLSPEEARVLSGGEIREGFSVCERSVDTRLIADWVAEAIEREPGITVMPGTQVTGVREQASCWTIISTPDVSERFDFVINCSWESLLAIDRTAGLEPEPGWSHRHRLSLFIETDRLVDVPSIVLAAGPFGDIKNYNGRRFYLSWYPAGLIAESGELAPPAIPPVSQDQIARAIRRGLEDMLPPVARIFDAASTVTVAGGWVFAQGEGPLSDPVSTIHRRDRFGIRQAGTYFSVDTGKYSTAPWLAERLASQLTTHVA